VKAIVINKKDKGNEFQENEKEEERLFFQEDKQILHGFSISGFNNISYCLSVNTAGLLFDKECKLVKVLQCYSCTPCNGP